jgi:hypothetical protein
LIGESAMVDETQTELNVGLSEEEKDDLEKLIKTLKSEQSPATSGATLEDVQKQVISMGEHIAQLSEMLLKFDMRIKSIYKIIRLFHKKSETMNERIDAIIRYVKRGKIFSRR